MKEKDKAQRKRKWVEKRIFSCNTSLSPRYEKLIEGFFFSSVGVEIRALREKEKPSDPVRPSDKKS